MRSRGGGGRRRRGGRGLLQVLLGGQPQHLLQQQQQRCHARRGAGVAVVRPHPLLLLLLSFGVVVSKEGCNVRVDSLPLLLVLGPSRGSVMAQVCAAVAHHGVSVVSSGGRGATFEVFVLFLCQCWWWVYSVMCYSSTNL